MRPLIPKPGDVTHLPNTPRQMENHKRRQRNMFEVHKQDKTSEKGLTKWK